MHKFMAYMGVARAPFLLLPVTLVASGAMAANLSGDFSLLRTCLALAGLIALHASVNAFNEVSDMKTGIDLRTQRTPFSGGSGTLPSGLLRTRAAFLFATALALTGIIVGAYFLWRTGPVMLAILIPGAICVLAYADILSHTGAGEIAAGLGLGFLPVMGAAIVQGGHLSAPAVAAAVPAFFMTFNLLLLNEFPDEIADRTGGRRHLVILLGRRRAALVYATAGLLTPLSIAVAVYIGALPAPALFALVPSLLLLMPLNWAFRSSDKPVPIGAMAANVGWNLLTNIVLAAAMLIAAENGHLQTKESPVDLEKRIQALEDLEEIKRLHQNYINLMDNLRYEQVLDLFTDDATVEVRNSGVKKGRKEISEIYDGLAKKRGNTRYDGHLAIEPDIQVDGNTARGAWLIYMLFSKPSIQWVQGKNECEYRKENGKWKLSKLKFTRTLASDPTLYP